MIPIKIISLEQAVGLGLTVQAQPPLKRGESACGAMVIMRKNKKGPDELMEKFVVKQNGKKELIFMHKDRAKHLKTQKQFNNYVKQFDKIKGIEK